MPKPSASNRTIARYAGDAFGAAKLTVDAYYGDDRSHRVSILSVAGQPRAGVYSYSTVGLSDTPLIFEGKEFHARVELEGAVRSEVSSFGNVMASAAFCVIKQRLFAGPGSILLDVLDTSYFAGAAMRHVLCVPPFLWPKLQTLELDDKTVAWLMAIPISDREMRFAQQHGSLKLEELFEAQNIDMFDIMRPSVL